MLRIGYRLRLIRLQKRLDARGGGGQAERLYRNVVREGGAQAGWHGAIQQDEHAAIIGPAN